MTSLKLALLHAAPDIPLYHIGPPLDLGPLPALFYFALSGPDSLTKDPYNQPVRFLCGEKIRIFSMDLPAHENGLPPQDALSVWADDYTRKFDVLRDFFDKAVRAIDFAVTEQFADPAHLSIGGLSRGGFAALHIAALEERILKILLFAPLTELPRAKEFAHLQCDPAILSLDPKRLAETLCTRHLRLYIGNRDTRVGTDAAFFFIRAVVEKAYELKIRSPQLEFFMTPSMGQHGHGTSPEIFRQGALWILA